MLYDANGHGGIQEYFMRSNKAAMHVLLGKSFAASDTGEASAHYAKKSYRSEGD